MARGGLRASLARRFRGSAVELGWAVEAVVERARVAFCLRCARRCLGRCVVGAVRIGALDGLCVGAFGAGFRVVAAATARRAVCGARCAWRTTAFFTVTRGAWRGTCIAVAGEARCAAALVAVTRGAGSRTCIAVAGEARCTTAFVTVTRGAWGGACIAVAGEARCTAAFVAFTRSARRTARIVVAGKARSAIPCARRSGTT